MTGGSGSSGPWPVEWFEEIDSTNSEARRRAEQGEFADVWLVAKSQTAGRGRLGRRWLSPVGNLYATALFHHSGPLRHVAGIPFVAGLSVCDAVTALVPDCDVRLKWPNDVRVDGAKLAGILVEAGALDEGVWVAVGFGINISSVPVGTGQDVTSISALCVNTPLTYFNMFESLQMAFQTRITAFNRGFSATRKAWLERAEGLGKLVRIGVGDAILEGIFEDMAADGALILGLPDGSRRTISTGDVELIRDKG